jgi:hypothetical protein
MEALNCCVTRRASHWPRLETFQIEDLCKVLDLCSRGLHIAQDRCSRVVVEREPFVRVSIFLG